MSSGPLRTYKSMKVCHTSTMVVKNIVMSREHLFNVSYDDEELKRSKRNEYRPNRGLFPLQNQQVT